MSYLHNKRRGAKANRPRKVRTCRFPTGPGQVCGAAVAPKFNGNECQDHRRNPVAAGH